ncbi:hypothetical protein [uncultured Brevundimonas sp.]|uniref:DUF4376 domain-containing protein n=1 Tax=uncultured Brevundimonas sp. TaxID=213418 RepID=UPI00261C8C5D|nr:hypothetical protein [uncultured Brevundimonas sp.]
MALEETLYTHLTAINEAFEEVDGELPARLERVRSFARTAVHSVAPGEDNSVEGICKRIDKLRDAKTAADFAYDFGETVAVNDANEEEAAGVRRLQMRSHDVQRWLAVHAAALTAIIGGQPETVIPIRAEDNWNIQTTAAQVVEVLTAAIERGAVLLYYGANLKAAVRAAEDPTTVDIVNGWPFDPVAEE